MSTEDLKVVIDAANERASELEWQARNPFATLSAHTSATAATAWASKQAQAATAIRAAAARLEADRKQSA